MAVCTRVPRDGARRCTAKVVAEMQDTGELPAAQCFACGVAGLGGCG
jgi:hypothetical protein